MTAFPESAHRVMGEDLDLLYTPQFVSPSVASAWFEALVAEVPWRQEVVSLFGRRHPAPRLTAWYGDAGVRYRYSGVEHVASGWSSTVQRIREAVESACASRFNAVLLNYYRDGNDCVGWHSDDEPALGEMPVIASVSLGGTRRFRLRRRAAAARGGGSVSHAASEADARAAPPVPAAAPARRDSRTLALTHGSLLVMRGRTQAAWQHCIPRCAAAEPRVNLTFRRVAAGR